MNAATAHYDVPARDGVPALRPADTVNAADGKTGTLEGGGPSQSDMRSTCRHGGRVGLTRPRELRRHSDRPWSQTAGA
jgi:hypothetical protein